MDARNDKARHGPGFRVSRVLGQADHVAATRATKADATRAVIIVQPLSDARTNIGIHRDIAMFALPSWRIKAIYLPIPSHGEFRGMR